MSLHKTKDQLVKLLGQTDNNVIALSGKWGTCSLNRVRQRVVGGVTPRSGFVQLLGSTPDRIASTCSAGVFRGPDPDCSNSRRMAFIQVVLSEKPLNKLHRPNCPLASSSARGITVNITAGSYS